MEAVLTIDFPDDLDAALQVAGYGPARLTSEARHSLAASLFTKRVLSLDAAARVAGMSLWEFIPFLGSQGIAVAEHAEDDAAAEVEAARWLGTKKTRS